MTIIIIHRQITSKLVYAHVAKQIIAGYCNVLQQSLHGHELNNTAFLEGVKDKHLLCIN